MGRKRADSFFYPRSPHSRDVDEVCADLRVKPDVGLKSEEIEFRRQDAGWNELDQEEKTPLWELVLEQFDDPLVKVLLLAAGISFAIGLADGDHWTHALVEPSVIIAILIINAIVGVWQESNAENALEALKSLQAQHAVVLRDGHTQEIESRELVPGDIVFVKAGDKVPADCRVLELLTTTLRVEQAALTGESETAMKDVHAVEVDTDITGKTNMLFSSTSITNGKAKALVVSIGMETEIGTIQASVQAVEDGDTPLKKKLDKFGDLLQKVIFWICVLVWMMKLPLILEGETWGDCGMRALYYLKIAVSLAVAAIPEGLPAVITTCLALGTRRMARRNAIIRKLPSVETLGSTTVICSDKTGTLTTNEMSVVRIATFDEEDLLRVREVTGVSYEPIGDVMDFSELKEEDKALLNFQKVCTLCNDSRIEWDEEGKIKRIGEPTEAAMKVVAEKLGVLGGSRNVEEITAVSDHWTAQFKRLATLEFSRDRKSMSVLCRGEEDSSNSLFVKGAPESVLARCDSVMMADGRLVTMDDQVKAEIQAVQAQMAGNALRTLACAVKTDGLGDLENYDGPDHKAHVLLVKPDTFAEIESDLTFVGMVGIIDPPRPEVRASIRDCHDAGVRVIVITGDNKNTAEAICRKIGVFDDSEDISEQSFIGREFMLKSEKEQLEILGHKSRGLVFSRSEPKHKLQLVTMLQSLNEVVAMTGDGVNDAPALKGADIGIAMGIAGTEVAKEASDMVLADDNFATIVAAVEEGRSIFNNTKAFIRYLISSNIGEVASIFITAAIGVPEGLLPVQLLWVNLVTDGPPATALGFNPPEKDVMKKPPRKTDEDLISGWVFFRYMVVGIYVGLATVAVFVFWFCFYDAEDGHPLVTFQQLRSFDKCDVNAPEWQDFAANINSYMEGMNGTASFALEPINNPCDWFEEGKVKASTMSLSVLVAIEMFNALNALSEDGSLLTMPPWANPWLLVAMAVSFILHFGILAIPACNGVFSVVNLTQQDWIVVIAFSAPVVLVDEVLKFVGRMRTRMARRRRKLE